MSYYVAEALIQTFMDLGDQLRLYERLQAERRDFEQTGNVVSSRHGAEFRIVMDGTNSNTVAAPRFSDRNELNVFKYRN